MKATHTIQIERSGRYWTSRIVTKGEILWSSTKQLYSRRIDAVNAARRFLKAARAGRVALWFGGMEQVV